MSDHVEPQTFDKIIKDPATRRWFYGVAAAVIVALQVYRLISPEEATAWSNIISAVVALSTAGVAIPNVPTGKDTSEPLG